MEAQKQPEPTMEEILASSGGIISEDTPADPAGDAPPAPAAAAAPSDDVFELTEVIPDDEPLAANSCDKGATQKPKIVHARAATRMARPGRRAKPAEASGTWPERTRRPMGEIGNSCRSGPLLSG